VDEFIIFARLHKHLNFLVTPIGCGLAGYTPEDIAPLFAGCMELENVALPSVFTAVLAKIDNMECKIIVSPYVTGVITDVTAHPDGLLIEGRADQFGQWCSFITSDTPAFSVEPGQRFEVHGGVMEIYPSVE
jgi:hypothetical protein